MRDNELSTLDLTRHTICFAALPFEDNAMFAYKSVLLPALRRVFEQSPHYWHVVRADDAIFAPTIPKNVFQWMTKADVGVVDISDLNPSVLMELGYMHWRMPELPLFILEREGTNCHFADLEGAIRVIYPKQAYENTEFAIEKLSHFLKDAFAKRLDIIHEIVKHSHYFSSFSAQHLCKVSTEIASVYSELYQTMEYFVSKNSKDITGDILRQRDIDISPIIIQIHQKAVEKKLKELTP